MMIKLDELDLNILQILQKDGRITNAKLAAQIGISPPAMLERVKRLETTGVISRFVALLDRKKIGIGVLAIISVSLAVHQMASLDSFKRKIRDLEEVLECYQISGDSDFILKVAISSLDHYSDFVVNRLTGIEGIQKIQSSFILETIKHNTAFPLNRNNGIQEA